MKKLFKRYYCTIVALILVLCCGGMVFFPAFAVTEVDVQKNTRIRHIVEEKIEEISDSEKALTVVRTKKLSDFAGNSYLLFECAPSGYFIFDPESGLFVEYSAETSSPYLGKTDGLFYGGPTFYYVKNDDEKSFSHLVLSEEILDSNDLAIRSNEIKSALKQVENENVLSYINGEMQLSSFNEDALETDTYIEEYGWIRNLSTAERCGYYCPQGSGGLCGYVAGGMVLLYFQNKNDLNLIPNEYLHATGWYFNGGEFTRLLREECGDYDSTTALRMLDVLTAYIPTGYTFSRYTYLLPTAGEIRSHIDRNHPVMLFGNLYSPIHEEYVNHAVVVYGYTSENELIAHFGWDNSYAIYVQSILPFGSALVIGNIS